MTGTLGDWHALAIAAGCIRRHTIEKKKKKNWLCATYGRNSHGAALVRSMSFPSSLLYVRAARHFFLRSYMRTYTENRRRVAHELGGMLGAGERRVCCGAMGKPIYFSCPRHIWMFNVKRGVCLLHPTRRVEELHFLRQCRWLRVGDDSGVVSRVPVQASAS